MDLLALPRLGRITTCALLGAFAAAARAQSLLFTDSNNTTLFSTDGATVTQLANGSSTPAFAADPLFGAVSSVAAGSLQYFIMADSTSVTSALWRYDGSGVHQLTPASLYVYNQADSNDPANPYPIAAFGSSVAFGLATTASDTGSHNTTQLAICTGNVITQPAVPNNGYGPHDFQVIGSTLYFIGTDSSTSAPAIYAYDGTTVTEVYNLHPTFSVVVSGVTFSGPAATAVQGPIAAFNGHIYFGSGQSTCYELTGTNTATQVASGSYYQYNPFAGNDLVVAANHLFFLSNNNGIFSVDSSNNSANVLGSLGAQSFTGVAYNNACYFFAANPGNGDATTLYTKHGRRRLRGPGDRRLEPGRVQRISFL